MKRLRRIFSLALVGGLIVSAGCTSAPVQPWQRGAFATYEMNPARDPLASTASDHIYFSREASSGGAGVGGSGCGCN